MVESGIFSLLPVLMFLMYESVFPIENGMTSSHDALWERCTSKSMEPPVTDSFCLINGQQTQKCSGISNWHSCLAESAERIDTPAARLTNPNIDQFTYYPEGRLFCYRPEVQKGEKLNSFRGFAIVDLFVGKVPVEYRTRVGCIYHESVKVTKDLLKSTQCCTQFDPNWYMNKYSPFSGNGYSIPHTVGAEQFQIVWKYFNETRTFVPPGYEVPTTPEPEPEPKHHIWIPIGIIGLAVLFFLILGTVVYCCKCSESFDYFKFAVNFPQFQQLWRRRFRNCWQAIEKRFRPGMVNADHMTANKTEIDEEMSGATQSAAPASENDTDQEETTI